MPVRTRFRGRASAVTRRALVVVGVTVAGAALTTAAVAQTSSSADGEPSPQPDRAAEAAAERPEQTHRLPAYVRAEEPAPPGVPLAYVTNGEASSAIWRVEADGAARLLVDSPNREFLAVAAAPAGDALAVLAAPRSGDVAASAAEGVAGSTVTLTVVNPDTGEERVVAEKLLGARPVWNPDGRRIAVGVVNDDGSADVVSVDVETGDRVTMVDASEYDLEPDWACAPLQFPQAAPTDWAPDGEHLLAVVAVTCFEETFTDVVVASPTGTRRAADVGPHQLDASFSPDGKKFVFAADDGIFTASLEGGPPTAVDAGTEPWWSGGDEIVYVEAPGGRDRGRQDLRTSRGRAADLPTPVERPRWASGGSLLMFFSSDDTTRGLYLLRSDGDPLTVAADPDQPIADATFLDGGEA